MSSKLLDHLQQISAEISVSFLSVIKTKTRIHTSKLWEGEKESERRVVRSLGIPVVQ